ncbi:MAG: hypothetical protein KKE57_01950 [Proteobacteria bacterium]|nr:hypothetical protein [Pseudomonadota bacterium]
MSETRFGDMVHARLGIAEENSGKLVSQVRQEAKKLAEANGLPLILTDGPPGVGCPVIASLGGATGVLIVTEPTVSGRHDMERVAELAAFFRVPAMVCVNKYDLNAEVSGMIEQYAAGRGIAFLGKIPFDPAFTWAMVQGKTTFEYDAGTGVAEAVREIWQKLSHEISL